MRNFKNLIVLIGLSVFSLLVGANTADDYFRAVQQDNESRVIALALRGIDLNTVNEKREHGLFVALRTGSLKVADFFISQSGVQVDTRTASGESPLMMAALKGHLTQAERLIARKAEVNKPGWTPLHYAATNPEPVSRDIVALLLEHHAYIDAESPNKSTPLMMAAHYGHPAVVKLLLESGADPLIKNEQGLTAINFANRSGRVDVAEAIAKAVRSSQTPGRW